MNGIATAVRRELPPPEEAFRRLQGRPGLFWLDSSLQRQPDGRFSAIGCNPRDVFEATGRPISALEAWLDERRAETPAHPAIPFWGGAVGWFGYDLGRQFEHVPKLAAPDGLGTPDIRLAWHDAAFVWDHQTGESWTISLPWHRPAAQAIAELEGYLTNSVGPDKTRVDPVATGSTRVLLESDWGKEGYMKGVEEARVAIARGEIYQVNLAHRFEGVLRRSPAEVYLKLRRLNPAPFSFYQEARDVVILGSSPERFVEVEPGGRIRTFPIKGTRPRGDSPESDAALRRALESSEKEKAELLMIVDLLRNDLGRVCETGSVTVKQLFSLESYATVHHLVGEIEGRLRAGVKLGELLRAIFPGGSISGAPKVSALAVIERLERHRRGLFTGAMGYIGANGRIDLNIAIRTIVCRGGRAYFQVGSGIVWDSDPAAEYAETLAKGRALFAALGAEFPQ